MKALAVRTINIQHNIFTKFHFRNYILCRSEQSHSAQTILRTIKYGRNTQKLDLNAFKNIAILIDIQTFVAVASDFYVGRCRIE